MNKPKDLEQSNANALEINTSDKATVADVFGELNPSEYNDAQLASIVQIGIDSLHKTQALILRGERNIADKQLSAEDIAALEQIEQALSVFAPLNDIPYGSPAYAAKIREILHG